jgi:hypothetical protein
VNCDIFVVKNGSLINNAIRIGTTTITGGRIFNATLLIPENLEQTFIEMGAPIATYTKAEVSLSQQPGEPSKAF